MFIAGIIITTFHNLLSYRFFGYKIKVGIYFINGYFLMLFIYHPISSIRLSSVFLSPLSLSLYQYYTHINALCQDKITEKMEKIKNKTKKNRADISISAVTS